MRIDPVWVQIVSDLFVNLAAGWLGVVLIVAPRAKMSKHIDWLVLTADMVAGIVSLVVAFGLKKWGGI